MTKTKGLTSEQMSTLHWTLRKKGYSQSAAYRTTGTAKKLSKRYHKKPWKKGKFGKHRYLDFDGDGKINKYDCKPFDKNQQDNFFKRLLTPKLAHAASKLGMHDTEAHLLTKQEGYLQREQEKQQIKEAQQVARFLELQRKHAETEATKQRTQEIKREKERLRTAHKLQKILTQEAVDYQQYLHKQAQTATRAAHHEHRGRYGGWDSTEYPHIHTPKGYKKPHIRTKPLKKQIKIPEDWKKINIPTGYVRPTPRTRKWPKPKGIYDSIVYDLSD